MLRPSGLCVPAHRESSGDFAGPRGRAAILVKSLLHGRSLRIILPLLFPELAWQKTSPSRTAPLSGRSRRWLVLTAVGLSALLGVARALEPNPLGHGTHQQLGLPPCTFMMLFNRPCPSCGMTTAWAWLMRGQVAAATRANAAGTLLGVMAVIGVPWLLVSAARGRWLPGSPNAVVWAAIAATVTLVAIIQWGWRLLGG